MKSKLIASTLVMAMTIAGCSTSSTGRAKIAFMDSNKLNAMGAQSFEEMKKKEKISKDEKTNAYVQCVANYITVHVPKSAHDGEWEVVVFDSEQINAFALPGGKIGVYTGILKVAEGQDQLAAIMGHEVAHVIEEHANERISAEQVAGIGLMATGVLLGDMDNDTKAMTMGALGIGAQYLALMPYGRSHETEADIVGQELMAKAGFKPEASVKLWQNMAKASGGNQPPEFMSTHPSNESRINQLRENLDKSEPIFNKAKTTPDCVNPIK
ncbi:M48 family metallopeptidase [Thalassotalea eurytherma]|uniref:Zn-dependent protease n=1 Tax=Thalassotalea eurytherma TaxID=1144278 RepID=A0ABQ6H6U0_9GAMM|nr:M48 family metallopeptidase [Thalassotalea eurytherma]GLX82606.1 Zn-dependent protease [Thalassotalea eurytherma]